MVGAQSPVIFGYDGDNLLTTAGALTLTRDASTGLVTGTSLGGVADTWTYNGFGELTGYKASSGTTSLFDVTYSRDALGRITQKVETLGGVSMTYAYTYDAAGRVTGVSKNAVPAASYTYDANGNRLTRAAAAGTTSATYDDQDRLTQYGTASYSYTDSGELKSKTNGAATTSYVYDALGSLLWVTLPGGTKVEYVVDPEGRRVAKKVNGTVQRAFLYGDALRPLAELDAAGAVVSRFVYGSRANVPDYLVKAGATYRIVADHLGSPRLLVNAATGAVAQRIEYDEFGHVLQDSSPGFQPFGFAGGLYDPDTGLVRFGLRDYDPLVGRWTAKDPLLFGARQLNLYAYVRSDPVNFKDPSGLFMSYDFIIRAAGAAQGAARVVKGASAVALGILGAAATGGGSVLGVGLGGTEIGTGIVQIGQAFGLVDLSIDPTKGLLGALGRDVFGSQALGIAGDLGDAAIMLYGHA